jgi:hypothetical protein
MSGYNQPELAEKKQGPFSLILPEPFTGNIYDRKNESAAEFKDFIRTITGNKLKPNQLGQLAAGLVHGQIYRIGNGPKPNLYSLAEGGRGITFHDPDTLYEGWDNVEKNVGPTMQEAIRDIIDYALTPPVKLAG